MVTIFSIITTTTILPTQPSPFLLPSVTLLALWKDLLKYRRLVEQIAALVPATMTRHCQSILAAVLSGLMAVGVSMVHLPLTPAALSLLPGLQSLAIRRLLLPQLSRYQ